MFIHAYHGTKRKFDRFDMSLAGTSGRRDYGHGIYFTEDPEIARRHGDVVEVIIHVDPDDLLNIDRPLREQLPHVRAKLMKALKLASEALHEAGLPGLTYTDYTGREPVQNFVIFDPSLIQIRKGAKP